MRHIRRITVSKAVTKDIDEPEEIMFFQLFFTVVTMMFSAAFGKY